MNLCFSFFFASRNKKKIDSRRTRRVCWLNCSERRNYFEPSALSGSAIFLVPKPFLTFCLGAYNGEEKAEAIERTIWALCRWRSGKVIINFSFVFISTWGDYCIMNEIAQSTVPQSKHRSGLLTLSWGWDEAEPLTGDVRAPRLDYRESSVRHMSELWLAGKSKKPTLRRSSNIHNG